MRNAKKRNSNLDFPHERDQITSLNYKFFLLLRIVFNTLEIFFFPISLIKTNNLYSLSTFLTHLIRFHKTIVAVSIQIIKH